MSLIADERYSFADVNKKENVTVYFYMDAQYLELPFAYC